MSSTKAKLIVTLKANETVVAEVEDPILWQKVLTAIQQPSNKNAEIISERQKADSVGNEHEDEGEADRKDAGNSLINKLSKRLGISESELIGAIDPSIESPYVVLDVNCWEKMKKQLPSRGIGSVSPTALVGTILCLWFKEAGLGNPTQAQVSAVLKDINVTDKNPSRAIKSATWLQGRGGGVIVLNPAEVSKAVGIVKSFCTKKWSKTESE